MKKLMLTGFFVIFFVVMAGAQTITITSPYPQTTWYKTETREIRWSANGDMDNTVNVILRQNNQPFRVLASGIGNNGVFEWTIPTDIPSGAYTIRVRTVSDQFPVVRGNSGTFNIGFLPDPAIEVYQPNGSSRWLKGQPYFIRWHLSGDLHSRVRIKLYNSAATTEIHNIPQHGMADNLGSFKWKVPDFLTPGQYKIFVNDYVNNVSDFSETFEIIGSEQFIAITDPSPMIGWCLGKIEDITWAYGGLDGIVNIELLTRTGKLMGTIAKYVPVSQGKFSWKVGKYKTKQGHWFTPSNWLPGSGMAKPSRYYKIKILSPSSGKHTTSRLFLLMSYIRVFASPYVSGTGLKIKIRWIVCGDVANSVSIGLFDSAGQTLIHNIGIKQTAAGQPETVFDWSVPAGIPSGNYLIKITSTDMKLSGKSDAFQLTDQPAQRRMKKKVVTTGKKRIKKK